MSCKNKDMNEWVLEHHYQNKLLIVNMNGKPYPVSNQICKICEKGWHNMDKEKIAIAKNVLYHASCLEKKLNAENYSDLVKSEEILEGFLS